ncbi:MULTISPECIES: hypothetical protein [Paenibacillus]|jgi:hypothetical protein|uniref:Uncharacterized protein n=1 Tax=Paenibacillus pseudetheri TaxID=2897682 RepID=A0ABN8FBM8_9BACL|nr:MULTISPECIES: hypothetical protein [Paenibacillus]MBY3623233.1 hypothetical protein [Acinetobacter sp. CUI P1]ETT47033.1 hypothetical protein C171_27106 [Paenibacillus sp. FSL H8-237]MDH6370811.1 hypothetical protein [Paenibacillus sp. PastF-3]MDH6429418.1 hypothetical protein [Paenibacillus sp. PastH-4]MDH6445626.1 hypothetical protein [Paenibacillus sp. PastF-4]
MNVTSTRTTLQVDDYLDLLNLAVKVGDLKWQKEIKSRLQYILCLPTR